jgi:pimeloyl-ACP methyl ester carboxylesterase
VPSVGRLRYLERKPSASVRGRGVLVLIHAFPLNARMWQRQLALADGGWHVVAPQLRGFDGGDSDPATNSIDDFAGDVVDLLDALHVQEAVVGGLSMGGYIAFAILRHAARYVQGLILADTKAPADTPEGVEGRKKLIRIADDRGPAAVADEMIPKLLGEATRRERPEIVAEVRSLILSNSTGAITGGLRALMTRPDSSPLLETIHVPTLVIVGSEDTVTPPSAARDLQRSIAGSQLVEIAAAGHLANLEQPELFDAAVGEFLSHRV